MDMKTYQECALRTMADQCTIRERLYDLGPAVTQLENGIRGLTNEVGELSEITKKSIEYGKGPPDVAHIKEEVGDCFWRLRQICDAVGLTFEECMQANIDKLAIRYPKEFSDINAAEENRDREAERQAMTPEAVVERLIERPEIMASLEQRIKNEVPQDWDKSPYNQNGQGWAEPGEEKETVPTIARKPLNHSYTRYCTICNLNPIHKSNSVGVCASCYATNGEQETYPSLEE